MPKPAQKQPMTTGCMFDRFSPQIACGNVAGCSCVVQLLPGSLHRLSRAMRRLGPKDTGVKITRSESAS